MDNESKFNSFDPRSEMHSLFTDGSIPEKYQAILQGFYNQVRNALAKGNASLQLFEKRFSEYLQLISKQCKKPYHFNPYHKKIRTPFDYYRFSLDFIRPLIDLPNSQVIGIEIATKIEQDLREKKNAILLANHQTEPDPQAIAILLEKTHPELAEKIIYVAGERVVTDPLAIPFSMGCDLLCIYSKRYIDYPPERKAEKQLHNKHTMEKMSRLLSEGGKVIYVAPSGGRDRKDLNGAVEVAPFDAQSIEMFYLMAKKAKTPTSFYPFTLATYELMPPPDTIQIELGEARTAKITPIQISFSPAFNMEQFEGSKQTDKTIRRKKRADAIWKQVNDTHKSLVQTQ